MSATERLNEDRPDWQTRAACHAPEVDPDWFFPRVGDPATAAYAVCEQCPVRVDCLEYAIANNEQHGIWGGTNHKERRRIARRRARDRNRGAA